MKSYNIAYKCSDIFPAKPEFQIVILFILLITSHLFGNTINDDIYDINSCTENAAFAVSNNDSSHSGYSLELVEGSNVPLIDETNPGSVGISHGFECGNAFLYKKEYHMFITEKITEANYGVDLTRVGHWKSTDGISWTRVSTILNTFNTPKNPKHAIWSPMPVYDKNKKLWNIFYVGYEEGVTNPHGRVFKAHSKTKGYNGLDGPYIDETDTVLSCYDTNKKSWEGKQGADSFFPYQFGKKWYGLYGSSDAASYWVVGLATANSLNGSWTRDNKSDPDFTYCENPIVVTLNNKILFCVYDDLAHGITDCHSIGYGYSMDGVHWVKKYLNIPMPKWAACVRTPLSFIYEGNDVYSIYFTALTSDQYNGFEKVGRIKVKLVRD